MSEFNLLRKTELRVQGITLHNANLNQIAITVAGTLGLEPESILVTDVLGDTLTLDIIKESVDARELLPKKDELLKSLSGIPGVKVTGQTTFSSEGILGWLALDYNRVKPALKRSEKIAAEIRGRLLKRAIVFPTGFEVASGQIEDTNSPLIARLLQAEGYSVTRGPTLKDDRLAIAAGLRQAVEDGYGLIITTGGVGAEAKDHTIEAVLDLDPAAVTSYICKFKKGTGRHHKDGVRIAVGRCGESLVAALPGPNSEVKAGMEAFIEGLRSGLGQQELVRSVAKRLTEKLTQAQTD